jgi:hypothetical protein
MKYSRTTKIVTILIIILFLFSTLGIVVLYFVTDEPTFDSGTSSQDSTIDVGQPVVTSVSGDVIGVGTGDITIS